MEEFELTQYGFDKHFTEDQFREMCKKNNIKFEIRLNKRWFITYNIQGELYNLGVTIGEYFKNKPRPENKDK